MNILVRYLVPVAIGLLLVDGANAQQVPGCGFLQNSYGPFDYRDPLARQNNLPIVEAYHFTPKVEGLKAGQSGSLNRDLDYTLRAFPNHPKALNSVARYALQGGKFEDEAIPSADCFFRRAMAFQPTDEMVRMLYANYLVKRGQREPAREQYEEALKLAPGSPEVNYDAGLFYLAEGELARARELAAVAYDGGYPLQGLKKKIAEADARRSK